MSSLAKEGEHQTRMAEVPSSILTRDNICGWNILFLSSKACDFNRSIANFV